MTQTVPATCVLGPGQTGLAIGLRVLNLDGSTYAAFSTTGVAETSILGTYRKASGVACPDAGAYIVWGTSTVDKAEATVEPQILSGDAYVRLGAPAGASVSADILQIKNYVDDIGTAGAGLSAIPWNANWDAEVQSEAQDAITASALATAAALAVVDGIVDDILVDTGTTLDTLVKDIPTNSELATALAGADDATLAAIAALNNLSSAQAQSAAAAALTAYDPPTKAELDSAVSPLATAAALAVVDGIIDDILVDTGTTLDTLVKDIPTNSELATALAGADDATLAAIAALNNLSSAQAQSAAAAALTAYDPPTKAELDSAVSPLATAAALAVVDGIVDDILFDTGTTLPELIGGGEIVGPGTYTDTITDSLSTPLDGVQVQLSTDSGGSHRVYEAFTNASGVFRMNPDPGTYYRWLDLAGYTFTQGVQVVVA